MSRSRIEEAIARRLVAFAEGERDQTAEIGEPRDASWVLEILSTATADSPTPAFVVVEFSYVSLSAWTVQDGATYAPMIEDDDPIRPYLRCVHA